LSKKYYSDEWWCNKYVKSLPCKQSPQWWWKWWYKEQLLWWSRACIWSTPYVPFFLIFQHKSEERGYLQIIIGPTGGYMKLVMTMGLE
jgi:hypothetical protein